MRFNLLLVAIFAIFIAISMKTVAAGGSADCACPRNLDPICASNGQTYSNLCTFECELEAMDIQLRKNLRIVKKGFCENEDEE